MLAALTLRSYHYFVLGLFLLLVLASAVKPALIYGDDYSDANVAIAGENFYIYGLKQSYGVPYNTFRGSYNECLKANVMCADTHYPAFPYWVNHGLRKIGIDTLVGFRLFAIFLSFLFALLLPRFFMLITENEAASIVAAGVYILTPAFLNYADSLHQHPLMSLFWMGFAWAWILFLRNQKIGYLLISFLIFLVSVWTSFEQFVFIPIVAVGSAFIEKKFKWAFWYLAILAIVPTGTLVFRIYQQGFLFGGWQAAMQDLLFAAQHRSGITWLEFFNEFQKRFLDITGILWALVLFSVITFWKNKESDWLKGHLRWSLLFFIAGLAWWVLMKQHFFVHIHTNSQMLPFYAFTAGLFLYEVSRLAESGLVKRAKRFLYLILFLVLVKSLGTDQWNRWLSLNPRLNERMAMLTDSLEVLENLKSKFNPKEMIYIESAAHNLAYHATEGTFNNFNYVSPENMCAQSFGWGIIRQESFTAELEQECISKGHFLQKSPALIFIKYK